VISDRWPGLEALFAPGREVVLADDAETVLATLRGSEPERLALAEAARARVLAAHTAAHRASELERGLQEALRARTVASERASGLASSTSKNHGGLREAG
jgi:spore maturation protein CgeB